jgi:hypothetical protein
MSENSSRSRPFDAAEFSDEELHLARQILLPLRRPLTPPPPPGLREPPTMARNLYVEQRETDGGVEVRLVSGGVVAIRCGEQVVYQDQMAEPLTEWVAWSPLAAGMAAPPPVVPAPIPAADRRRIEPVCDPLSRPASIVYDRAVTFPEGVRTTHTFVVSGSRPLLGTRTTVVYDPNWRNDRNDPPRQEPPGDSPSRPPAP